MLTATYSPDDNKLRLYSTGRLATEDVERVKAAGFRWASRQELWVAPAWSPSREDLLIELCGEVGDEDTSLAERAEERAERFVEYREKRADDSATAAAYVATIAGGIPMGQPILVGHHSERRARKDAERIDSGTRKAIKLWETAQYWESRAKGALRHAKYKELPSVRGRRIKKLEAELRKQKRGLADAERYGAMWAKTDTVERATAIANYDHASFMEEGKTYSTSVWSMLKDGKWTAEQAVAHCVAHHAKSAAWYARWIAHLENRLAYERAMLAEGTVAAPTMTVEALPEASATLVALKAQKRAGGVQVVTNPDLFPTPVDLAKRMAKLCEVEGHVVLEPSAGTGRLASAAKEAGAVGVVCLDQSSDCVNLLRASGHSAESARDFLECSESTGHGGFGRILMNPPFSGGRDIDHVTHAWKLLELGGRLVAVMSAGVESNATKKARDFRANILCHGTLERLPEGTFKESGTNVRTVLVVLNKPEAT